MNNRSARITKKISFFLVLNFLINFIIFQEIFSRTIITGSQDSNNYSFNFLVNKHAFSAYAGFLFTGAGQAIADNNYALAVAGRERSDFVALAPATTTINFIENQINPINGAQIAQLTCWGDRPLLVLENKLDTLYFLYKFVHNNNAGTQFNILSLENIKDTENNPAKIVTLSTDSDRGFVIANDVSIKNILPITAFATVIPAAGSPGDIGTGIAVVNYKSGDSAGTKAEFTFRSISALNNSSSEIKIGNNNANIIAINDMYYDPILKRLFIALQAQANNINNSGVRSIVVGNFNQAPLEFVPIAPDSAFDNLNNYILGVINANSFASAYKIRVMHTSTCLPYLIIVGDTNNNINSQKSVYALPLVDHIDNKTLIGTIAAKDSKTTDIFTDRFPHFFVSRFRNSPASTPENMPNSSDINTQVGGSVILPGTITDLQVSTDAVIVSVINNDNTPAGIYQSQALFSADGTVQAWTNWQRVGGTSKALDGFAFDPFYLIYWSIFSGDNKTTVTRSDWTDSNLAEKFINNNSGVQFIFNFGSNTPGFSQDPGQKFSILAISGINKLLLKQSLDSDTTKSFSRFYNNQDLPNIGDITSITTGFNGTDGWIFIGGTNGLAVLCEENGSGWTGDLQPGLEQLDSLKFKKIGNFKNILKLIAHDNNLYILTNTGVEKFVLDKFSFNLPIISSLVKIVDINNLPNNPESLSDLIISNKLAVLATSKNLLSFNLDINTNNWQIIDLNESSGPITRLYAISRTGLETDFSNLGNIYVLNGAISLHQSKIYRLTIDLKNNKITSNTVQKIPDYFIQNLPSFFINVGDYRNYITNDGAIFELSRSKYLQSPIIFEKLLPDFRPGIYGLANKAAQITSILPEKNYIRMMLRESATGSLLVYGDFGIKINN